MAGCYGQDWASFQGPAPSASGLAFAFVKVTEGLNYINPDWIPQYADGIAHGLLMGKYHFPHMANSPITEADYFLAHADILPGDMVVLDWEEYPEVTPAAQMAAYKDQWLRYVKKALPNHRVGLYCNVDFWTRVDTSSYYGDFLWIATAGRPMGDPGIQAKWLFHQYSASGVDRDWCPLDVAQLRAFVLGGAITSTPTPPVAVPPVTTPPAATPPETEMTVISFTVPPIVAGSLKAHQVGIELPKGQCRTVAFGSDGTYLDGPTAVPPKLRVAVLDGQGWDVIANGSLDVPFDKQTVVNFRDPATTVQVVVVRLDTGDFPVFGQCS
jgi:hypothetical protein